ncbi:unnamed protein product [Hydatigera taeniaeformis]|uniref:Death domain-containing protein n=1 Tax=Hydatigena taeniaeformis TaxID=6205 RepID=A0A0R3X7E0_HYDTA|nr:unnamed protein product [Hydatigera taeniaeformis]
MGGGEQKQGKLAHTNEKLQKLVRRKEEGQNGEGGSKHAKLSVNTEVFQKIRIKKEEGQNGRKSAKEKSLKAESRRTTKNRTMSGDAHSRTAIMDLPHDGQAVESGPVKNPDEDCEMVTAVDTDNLTKVQFQFLEAARTNRCDILGMIIEQHACRLDLKNNLDRTALHLAAAQGCFEAVQMLVNARASVDIPDKHGMTPMFWAAYKDYVDIVVYLIKHGASVYRKTKRGFTLLHVLAKADAIKTLETLVRSKIIRNFQELDLDDCTPLMVATMSGSLRAATVLSRIGNLESNVDKTKKNVFHLAVLGGSSLVLEQLCKHEEMPKLINAFDDDLMAPIHYATDLDDYDSVSVLLKYGARVNIKSKKAPFPIITASRHGNIDLINLLLTNKARISAKDFRLQTPFNAAVEQDSAEVAELLILAGAPINEVDRAAKKPLMQAALSGFVRIVDMIIKAERWRSTYPAAAAIMAKKYNPKGGVGDAEDESGTGDEYGEEEVLGEDSENANSESTNSISEAPTYTSKSSNSGDEDGESDDDSLSQAETYHSDTEGSRELATSENSAELSNDVFTSPRQYRKAESVHSSTSASGSARGRMIERSKRQKAVPTSGDVYDASVSHSNLHEEEENPSSTPKLSRSQSSAFQFRIHSNSLPSLDQAKGSAASKPPIPSRRAREPKAPASLCQSPVTLRSCTSFSPLDYRFLVFNQSYAGQFQAFFFYFAYKKLRQGEWKSLARHWDFSEEQIDAIEIQHTGDKGAYKEHGYRLLCIWMHGLSEDTDPAPLLHTALTSIGRKMDAKDVQKDFYKATHGWHSSNDNCHIS